MRRLIKPLLRQTPKALLWMFEVVGILALFAVMGISYGCYRLAQGPVDLEFARPYLQTILIGHGKDVPRLSFHTARAHWPDFNGPILVDFRDLTLTRGSETVFALDNLSVSIAKMPLLIGLVRPERVMVQAPDILIERNTDHQLRLSWGSDTSHAPTDWQALLDPLNPLGLFHHVHEIEIRQARIRIADAALGMTWAVRDVTVMFRAVDIGLFGTGSITLPGGQTFTTTLTYRRGEDLLALETNFDNLNIPGIVGRFMGNEVLRHQRLPLTGTLQILASTQPWTLQALQMNAKGAQGVLHAPGMIDQPLSARDLDVAISYDPLAQKIHVDTLRGRVNDLALALSGEVARTPNGDYQGDLHLKPPPFTLGQVAALWPMGARDTPLGKWITQKLGAETQIQKLDVTLPLSFYRRTQGWQMLALWPRAAFHFENLSAHYRDPLDPVTRAMGTATIENDTLTINATSGRVQNLDLSDTTITIKDLTKKGAGHADVNVTLKGQVTDILAYLGKDPIKLGADLPVDRRKIAGTGTYQAHLSFPTIKDLPIDAVEADGSASIKNLTVPGIYKNVDLQDGALTLITADGTTKIEGTGTLNAAPLTYTLSLTGQNITRAQVNVETNDSLRQVVMGDAPYLGGTTPLSIDIHPGPKNTHQIGVIANLTPAIITIPELNYTKKAGAAANGAFTLTLQKGAIHQVHIDQIKGPALNIKNAKLTLDSGMVRTATLPQLMVGQTNLRADITRQGNTQTITLSGKRLDLGVLSAKESGPKPAQNIRIDVAELGFGGPETLGGAALDLRTNERDDVTHFTMTGVAGGKPVKISYTAARNGQMNLKGHAGDAGAFLRALDVYPNMIGGTLTIDGRPMGNAARDVQGRVAIADFSIVKAPVLAQLLGAMSLKGLGDQLSNKGIGFDKLSAYFAWQQNAAQNMLQFKEGRTAGSALGLTFEGAYDRRHSKIDINGTIIPAAEVNKLTSRIPLIGELLSGGKDSALFAATYAIKGPADSPKTTINPLAVLTPGILRKIFFE